MEVVLVLAVSVVALLVALSPLAFGVWALVVLLQVQGHRARDARVPGTVVESPVSVSSGGVAVPTGSGGMTFVPGGGRLSSRPVVTYYGPQGEVLTAKVRYGAAQVYVYGQPVELLVDPRNPAHVRLTAADGRGKAGRLLLASIMATLPAWGLPALLIILSLR
ncbi:MAG: DUF3592 domain-containing protein [bacterium]|jgi:hypothetical protein|nr:DUF3592 domain-containing protein [bacterium]